MPSLSKHQSKEFTKMLIEGDSGTGKSGALASLVKAGYKLRILDFDNGLDVLKAYIEKDCPENIDNVDFRTLRDKRKASSDGPVIDGTPKAFVNGLKMLDRWKYSDDAGEVDLGVPANWGSDTILVIDSLTFMSDAAWDFREPLALRSRDGKYDVRAVYGDAQGAVESVLALLTGDSFRTNVIVTSHIKYMDQPDGTTKGFPTSVGKALGPIIPRYFNTVVSCETKNRSRIIQTRITPMLDLKNSKPFEMKDSYPIETGLADVFAVLRPAPKKLTLVRK